MLKLNTTWLRTSEAYRNCAEGSTARSYGCPPVSKGEPFTGVKTPLAESIAKVEIAPSNTPAV